MVLLGGGRWNSIFFDFALLQVVLINQTRQPRIVNGVTVQQVYYALRRLLQHQHHRPNAAINAIRHDYATPSVGT